MQVQVMELPRHGQPLHEGTLASCVRFIEGRDRRGVARLVLVVSVPPPDEGIDAVACVPLEALADWTDRAVDVVAGWEATWCLIESMPARHRDDARDDLWHAIGAALLAAAFGGVAADGGPPDTPF